MVLKGPPPTGVPAQSKVAGAGPASSCWGTVTALWGPSLGHSGPGQTPQGELGCLGPVSSSHAVWQRWKPSAHRGLRVPMELPLFGGLAP